MNLNPRFLRQPMALLACALLSSLTLPAQTPTPNPSLPEVVLLATDPAALAGTSSGAFTLIRYGTTNDDLVVHLRIGGTASNGVDYVAIADTATIPAGWLAVDISVQPIVDLVKRHNKTVVLAVETNAAYRIGPGIRRATVTIVDDTFNTPPPSVQLVSPTNGSEFAFPATIPLLAEASDPEVAIRGVSFFANDYFLGRVTNAPYSLVWSNARPGPYVIFARAVDSLGQSTLSAPAHIAVTRVAPVVKITSPTNGMNFLAGQTVTIHADASDSAEPIDSVTFLANGHPLGVSTNAPYSVSWSNVHAGLYRLEAVAQADSGVKSRSTPVLINVSPVK